MRRKAKQRLEEARLCFLVDLWRLRGLVERVTRAVLEDEKASMNQACEIHFFVPELYFDDYTLLCLRRASDVFLEHISAPRSASGRPLLMKVLDV